MRVEEDEVRVEKDKVRVEEEAVSSVIAGKADSARMFDSGVGMTGLLTTKNSMDFWAPGVARVYRQKGAIYISNKDKHCVTHADTLGYRIGVVSYSGSGAYSKRTFQYLFEVTYSEGVADEVKYTSSERGGRS